MSDDRELRAALRDGPFHVALRVAVQARGLTLNRLRHRLGERGLRVGTTSLSYWQQGLRRPERPESLRAVRALEEILILPPRRPGPPRRAGRPGGGRAAVRPGAADRGDPDDPLRDAGETQMIRYEMADPSGAEAGEYERGFRFPTGQYMLRVGFDPAALPVRIHRFARRGLGADEHDRGELTLNAQHAVHLVAGPLQAGLVGVQWDWG
ncbi:hypothetical protein OG884_06800 [Streptosporangium sp. NBC_01755]|uniref:hypothetical protein n=1 Tax=unclassified Streptosporangium TaxID=2632669 RepID=UPI002DD86335|nr:MULTISPECIES: hypothetical protein [unclassified Streptosporangium]WSA26945.1 hypothetical protein OIE13_03345 [Streptosporangium sp. NBC_01810]WSD01630.1 hypothetical protein OG884_06800 [Streptosporangium sp. NBC_01755]